MFLSDLLDAQKALCLNQAFKYIPTAAKTLPIRTTESGFMLNLPTQTKNHGQLLLNNRSQLTTWPASLVCTKIIAVSPET